MVKAFFKIKRIFLIACLSFFVVPNYSYASSSNSSDGGAIVGWTDMSWNWLMSLGLGVSSTNDAGSSQAFPIQNPPSANFYNYGVNKHTQTSALYEAFFGAETHLFPGFLFQAGFDYTQASPYTFSGPLIQGTTVRTEHTYAYHYGVLARQLLFEGKLLATLGNYFHPYLLAGLGAAFNKAYNYYTSSPPGPTLTRFYKNNTATSFTYSLGAGLDIDLTNKVRFGIGYRFSNLGHIQLGSATFNSRNISGTLSQSSFYTNALLAQLTYIF